MPRFNPVEASAKLLGYLSDKNGEFVSNEDCAKFISAPLAVVNRLLYDMRETTPPQIESGISELSKPAHRFIGAISNKPKVSSKSDEDVEIVTKTQKTSPSKATKKSSKKSEKVAAKKVTPDNKDVTKKKSKVKRAIPEVMLKQNDVVALNEAEIIEDTPKENEALVLRMLSESETDTVLDELKSKAGSATSLAKRLNTTRRKIQPLLNELVENGSIEAEESELEDEILYFYTGEIVPEGGDEMPAEQFTISSGDVDIFNAISERNLNQRELTNVIAGATQCTTSQAFRKVLELQSDELIKADTSTNEIIYQTTAKFEMAVAQFTPACAVSTPDYTKWIHDLHEALNLTEEATIEGSMEVLRNHIISLHDNNHRLTKAVAKMKSVIQEIE